MTISFDAIWIPTLITLLAAVWAFVMLREPGSSGSSVFVEASVGIAWPSIPVLGSWLIWALLT